MKTMNVNKKENGNYSLISSPNMKIINYKTPWGRLSNNYPLCEFDLLFNSLNNPEHGEVNLIEVEI